MRVGVLEMPPFRQARVEIAIAFAPSLCAPQTVRFCLIALDLPYPGPTCVLGERPVLSTCGLGIRDNFTHLQVTHPVLTFLDPFLPDGTDLVARLDERDSDGMFSRR